MTSEQLQVTHKSCLRFARHAVLLGFACALIAALGVVPATAGETVLHSFVPNPQGANPQANVCLGPGGKLYGTTYSGGPAISAGVVYRLDHAGHEAVLHSFAGGADGANPEAGVICDSAGNIYGTTVFGGSAGVGTVFRVDGAGHESVLYSFTGGAVGGNPYAGLIQDSAGNLYGTTSDFNCCFAVAGGVFKLDRTGHLTVLYTFTGGNDGGYPTGSLVRDSAGNLYGTTEGGGTYTWGVVFKLDTQGNESVLYNFTGGNDGGNPDEGVIMDSAGNLYGTAPYGGAAGGGVVFKLDMNGNETVLYNFTYGADGGFPNAAVIMDSAGNLYGTTAYGGSGGAGVVYKVDVSGHEAVIYSFTGKADGGYPYAGVVMDSAGNLYGAASGGGMAGAGVLFKLDPAGHYTVLYSFPGVDGSNPQAGVIQDSTGNLYGTTNGGGPNNAGIVYKLDAARNEAVLYSFTGGADGGNPYGGVIQDSTGNLYGAAGGGGPAGAGLLYKLDSTGHQSVLYSFTGGADGASPNGVIMDSAGNFYGTTGGGGSAGKGVVFKVDPMGHETVLHTFLGGADGANPFAGVARDSAGNLYGTTRGGGSLPHYGGVVYKLDPIGNYTVLHNFTYGADGGYPLGDLILDSAGNLYGTTWSGGPPSGDEPGVVFKIDTMGNFSLLYTFTGFSDGGGSRSNLVFDPAGNLYGTTQYGGIGYCPYFGCGVVFELNPSGQQTVLYSFSGGSDGSEPGTGLIRDASGNLYGTTSGGGIAGAGVVYEITPGVNGPTLTHPVHPLFDRRGLGPNNPMPWDPLQMKEEPGPWRTQ